MFGSIGSKESNRLLINKINKVVFGQFWIKHSELTKYKFIKQNNHKISVARKCQLQGETSKKARMRHLGTSSVIFTAKIKNLIILCFLLPTFD